jgi:hypothetical protein
LLLAFSVWPRALGKMLATLAWGALVEYGPIHWIQERFPLNTQLFTEIEMAAAARFHERKARRLRKRYDEWLRIAVKERDIKMQKENEAENKEFLKMRKTAITVRKRAMMSGPVFAADLNANDNVEMLGKDLRDDHMV